VRFLEVDRTAGRDPRRELLWSRQKRARCFRAGRRSNSAASGSINTTTTSPTGAQITSGIAGQSIGVTNSTVSSSSSTGTLVPVLSGLFAGSAATTPFGALLAQVVNTNGVKIDTLISALEEKGLVKTLAEPDLISQSGEKASFFAGAQIPIPTVQPGTVGSTPTVTVNYFPCGVTLNFVPTVLNTGLINMHLAPQVCQVSGTTSVSVNGTQIPELNSRSADNHGRTPRRPELRHRRPAASAGRQPAFAIAVAR